MLPICEPWKTVCAHNEEFAALFRDVGIAYDQPPPPREWPSKEYVPNLPLADLFAQVNEANYEAFCRVVREKVVPADEDHLAQQLATGDRYRMILALCGLRKLRTARAFDAVKSYIETSENADPKVRWRAWVVIEEMPTSLTLDLARQWFRRKEWYLHVPAGQILERHAALEDMPLLLEALRTPETIRCEDHRLGRALWAMARFPGFGWIPEVEQVFRSVPDCRRRYDAANAMHITAPAEFVSQYAFECLWDCHSYTRALGCKVASLSTPTALERVRDLATDTSEDDDVRQAAQERLEES